MKLDTGRIFLLLLLVSFFTVLSEHALYNKGIENRRAEETVEAEEYRRRFFSDEMLGAKDTLSEACRSFLNRVEADAQYFPIPESTLDESLTVSYVNSWMAERSYKGESVHEGTDIMAGENVRGLYPVLSMSDGVVTNIGWLEKGGYRGWNYVAEWRLLLLCAFGVLCRYKKGRQYKSRAASGIYGGFRIWRRRNGRQV